MVILAKVSHTAQWVLCKLCERVKMSIAAKLKEEQQKRLEQESSISRAARLNILAPTPVIHKLSSATEFGRKNYNDFDDLDFKGNVIGDEEEEEESYNIGPILSISLSIHIHAQPYMSAISLIDCPLSSLLFSTFRSISKFMA